jgi:hypothetical protein
VVTVVVVVTVDVVVEVVVTVVTTVTVMVVVVTVTEETDALVVDVTAVMVDKVQEDNSLNFYAVRDHSYCTLFLF